jgi:hypothetical protein
MRWGAGRPTPKKYVYLVATLVASVVILPFQGQVWALYVGACASYSLLVFGLRHLSLRRFGPAAGTGVPRSRILLIHANFLAIVVGWVWLLIAVAPHLPYFLRTEDSDRPYFGLAFIGIVGLMVLEMFEQRFLRPAFDAGDSKVQLAMARRAINRKAK